MPATPLLTVRRLSVDYPLPRWLPWRQRRYARVVDGIDFNLEAGETLGIVGESGCGKSTLARALIGMQPVASGAIHFQGRNLARLSKKDWRPLRREIQMVFQDPLASLDPRMSIGKAIEQPLIALKPELDAAQRQHRVAALLERVGLDPGQYDRRPAEFSGGQCQRVGLARALILEPKLLICDEPVSALDVSVQAQVINLLAELQKERGLAMIFIGHDLAVVRLLAPRLLVLYAGRVMEQGSRELVFGQPAHPYTQALLASVPGAQSAPDASLPAPDGEPPDPALPLLGCAFRSRCAIADDHCARHIPPLRKVRADQFSACHFGVVDSVGA